MVDTASLKGGNLLEGMGLGGFSIGTVGTVFMWIGIFILVAGILTVGIIWWYNRRLYTQNIWVFGKVGGVPMLKYIDKGRLIAFGMAGDKLLNLKKTKKFLPPPRIQMGKNIYWFYERED